MIDRTRSSIEEDFSLEEQNFQSVIDMETEDDYSRGNQVLFTSAFGLSSTGATVSQALFTGNFFIEDILLTIAYMQIVITTPVSALNNTMTCQIIDNVGNVYLNYISPAFSTTVGPGTFTFPLNTAFDVDTEVLAPRGGSFSFTMAPNGIGVTTNGAFGLNIYGRQVP